VKYFHLLILGFSSFLLLQAQDPRLNLQEAAQAQTKKPAVSVTVKDQNSRSFVQTSKYKKEDQENENDDTLPITETVREQDIIFSEDAKKTRVVSLVDKGKAYFNQSQTSLEDACHAFTRSKEFVDGELFIFMYDMKGNCIAHGNESNLMWRNLYNLRDTFGTLIVQSILDKAKSGGGWVTYEWRNATRVSYIQKVTKNDQSYALGVGFYPHSKSDAVVNLVKGAVSHFYKALKEGRRKEEAFSDLSYPLGRFVYGDLYIFVNDFKGRNMVQGDQPGLIGTDEWNLTDTKGKLVVQEMIQKLKKTDEGIWVEYIFRNALKKTYIEKVIDREGNFYLIGCGYHPDANRDAVIDLVRKGYEFMKKAGKTEAARVFSNKQDLDFHYGDLFLRVYSMKGFCEAHGGNPDFIGQNRWDVKDEDGRYYIREMIEKGKNGGGWINVRLKNSLYSMYVEAIDLGVEEYVISAGVYPISKGETMILLAKSGLSYLESHDSIGAFAEFTRRGGRFIRGDLDLMVFDTSGICYAYGDDYDLIWRNLLNYKDDDGRQFIKIMINEAKEGPALVSFRLNGAQCIAYLESVNKNGRTYIVGSRFYN
jgi:signal transduction histidine kinase